MTPAFLLVQTVRSLSANIDVNISLFCFIPNLEIYRKSMDFRNLYETGKEMHIPLIYIDMLSAHSY